MKFSNDEPKVDGEWLRARIGKLTASRMKDAMSFKKNGEETEDRKKYKMDLVAERMTDCIVSHYVTPAMEHGLMYEQEAKLAYAALTGRRLIPANFIDHPTIECCGATPDSFVDHDGLLEIKCPTTPKYIAWLLAGTVPEEHMPQMALQMLCTERGWADFCGYDPRMPPNRRIFVRRFVPSAEYLRKIEAAAIQFLREVDELFERVTTAEMVEEKPR